MRPENVKTGVGGWLLLLVAGLIFIGPGIGYSSLVEIFETSERNNPSLIQYEIWNTYKETSWSIFFVLTAIGFAAAFALLNRFRSSTVYFVIICLWLIGPGGNIAVLINIYIVVGSQSLIDTISGMLGTIVASLIGTIIWTLYLLKSKRIKYTYNFRMLHSDDDLTVTKTESNK